MNYDAVIFDLDGVLLSTDNFHYLGWKQLADREGIAFNREINERLRGVSRMESLEIILERAAREYTAAEKDEMCTYKNSAYRNLLQGLTPADLFPGVRELLADLRRLGVKAGVASSSKNTMFILEKTGLADYFKGCVADGTCIRNSKPHPEVFLKSAEFVGANPARCLAVEDADAAIIAAKAAGMATLGVGPAAAHEQTDFPAKDISSADWKLLLG